MARVAAKTRIKPPTTDQTTDPLAIPLDRMRIPRMTCMAKPTRNARFRPGGTGLGFGGTLAIQAQAVVGMPGSSGRTSDWANAGEDSRATRVRTPKPVPPLDR